MFFNSKKEYHNIFTHLTIEEKEKLLLLASNSTKKSNFVEIGSYLGASACFLALGAKKNDSKLYCVDTWQNQEMSEGMRDTYNEFLHNTKPLSKYIVPLKGWSVNIAKSFDKKINLIFFDGGHSYETVKADWEAWSPKLADKAIVIFHDIGWAEGVKKVINEDVLKIIEKQEYLPNMWWGTLK